jgi:hypothetical protein
MVPATCTATASAIIRFRDDSDVKGQLHFENANESTSVDQTEFGNNTDQAQFLGSAIEV